MPIEQYLQKSEIMYFCKIDLNGNYTYVSPLFEKVFEYTTEEILGVNSLETIYIEDHQKTRDIIQKCFENPNTYQSVVLRKPLKNGNLTWTQWEFYIETDVNNQPLGVICYGFDLTESIKVIELLNQVRLDLEFLKNRTLFETSNVAIILHNADGDIFDANQYFCDMVGIKKVEISKYNFKKFILEKDWVRNKRLTNKLLKNKRSISYEKKFINKFGELVPMIVEKRVFYDGTSEPFIWCIGTDILEKEKQKELLQKQKEMLEQTAQIAKLGGWELDVRTSETRWTNEIYEIYDLEIGDFQNLINAISFYHPDDQTLLTNVINNAILNRENFDLELRFISAKNINKWVRVVGQPEVKNGEVIILKGVLQDITAKKKNEDTIAKQNNILEEISFTQSHVVRLPIANILGLINLIELSDSTEEMNDIYQKIKHCVNQLDQIVRDVANKKITD